MRKFAEHEESVRETWGYPELVMVVFRQNTTDPTPECRRAAPDVHSYIEHLTGYHANELSLGLLYLVVPPAKNVARRAALVVLNEARIDACRGKFAPLPGFEEVTSGVAEDVRANEHDIRNVGAGEFHNYQPRETARR